MPRLAQRANRCSALRVAVRRQGAAPTHLGGHTHPAAANGTRDEESAGKPLMSTPLVNLLTAGWSRLIRHSVPRQLLPAAAELHRYDQIHYHR